MSFKIILLSEALKDLDYWRKNDKNKIKRIKRLLEDIAKHPYTGIGKPEALKFNLAGKWSRRIDNKNRIVYKVENDKIIVFVFSMCILPPKSEQFCQRKLNS